MAASKKVDPYYAKVVQDYYGKQFAKKAERPMPKDRTAARADSVARADSLSKAEADSLGKHHMAVAANKARANLAAGQKAREDQQTKAIFKNPFNVIADVLKRGKK
jgi:hypothetical protein